MQHSGDLDPERFAATPQRRDAALFQIVVLGGPRRSFLPSFKHLRRKYRGSTSENMRNLVVHAYRQIDYGIVADTIKNDLEPLRQQPGT